MVVDYDNTEEEDDEEAEEEDKPLKSVSSTHVYLQYIP